MNEYFKHSGERPAVSHETAALDTAHLAHMTMGDRHLESEVLRLFARQSEIFAEKAAATAEAAELAALAHTLKGSAAAVGAWRVAHCAERLEAACAGETMEASRHALREVCQAVAEVHVVIAGLVRPT
jgi:HPt (histidine-containing phosphotransfer) domain-containing protein